MKKICLILFGLFLANNSFAATFDVSTFAELQTALTTAASNGQSDIINIAAGTINVTTTLNQLSSGEDYAIEINGDSSGGTVLDGGGAVQVCDIDMGGSQTASITLRRITFQNGSIVDNGAGLYVRNGEGSTTLEDCRFLNNSAGDSRAGGGVYIRSSALISINRCFFVENSADYTGGGLYVRNYEGTTTITNCVFRGNTANTYYGGGAYIGSADISSAAVNLINNTFVNNTSQDGGGGFSIYSSLSEGSPDTTINIYNNILRGNTSVGEPSTNDLYIRDDVNVQTNLYNNNIGAYAFWDGSGPDPNPFGTFNQGDNIDVDPILTADSHLQSGSQCINSGLNSAPFIPATDFEEDNRIIDGIADIGADEYDPDSSPANSIPTMNEWGMIVLSLLLGGIAVWYMRKECSCGSLT